MSVALVVSLVAPVIAHARGTYTVQACAGGPDRLFTVVHPAPGMRAYDQCPYGQNSHDGIAVATTARAGNAPNGAYEAQVFAAPDGTRIIGLHQSFHPVLAHGSGWHLIVSTSAEAVVDCADACHPKSATASIASVAPAFRPASSVRIALKCERSGGCPFTPRGHIVRASLINATITLDDGAPPKLLSLGPVGWHAGTQRLTVRASDNASGVRGVRLLDARGATLATWAASRAPAGSPSAYAFPSAGLATAVDTTRLPDGRPARVTMVVTDGVGNVTRTVASLYVDNTKPAAPVVREAEGQLWRPVNLFHLSWGALGDLSGVAYSVARFCPIAPVGACFPDTRLPASVVRAQSLPTLRPADWVIYLRFVDTAGNSSAWSAPVHMRYDNAAPGTGRVLTKNGWYNANEVARGSVPFELVAGINPISGVRGYATAESRNNDSAAVPGTAATVLGTRFPLSHLTATGVWHVSSRAISGAGVVSPTYGARDVLVDVDPPAAHLSTDVDLAAWHKDPVIITVIGVDPAGGSGMAMAAPGFAPDSGASISYAVDQRAAQVLPGDRATVVVADEGSHVVRFHASDLARNDSTEQTGTVRIDRTPPDRVAILPASPSDPRRVDVAAHDALSGVTGGEVQVRRQGTSQWLSMPTSLVGGRVRAEVNDDGLPDGAYDVRALVYDAAGNVAIGGLRQNAGPATLSFPLRVPTQLFVSSCGKPSPRGRGGARCAPRLGAPASLRVPFGHTRTVVGLLQSNAHRALAGQPIVISSQPASGGTFARRANVRTDRRGYFRYRVPAGTSRHLRFGFDGSGLLRAASSELQVAVPAHTSVRISARHVHPGGTVRFSGRLPGPLPSGPVVVVPEAFFRGAWHPVGRSTVADASGRWHMPYAFLTSTSGAFAFRVEVPRQAGYPYADGHSRTVRVVVG